MNSFGTQNGNQKRQPETAKSKKGRWKNSTDFFIDQKMLNRKPCFSDQG